jgi:hypothetical protein
MFLKNYKQKQRFERILILPFITGLSIILKRYNADIAKTIADRNMTIDSRYELIVAILDKNGYKPNQLQLLEFSARLIDFVNFKIKKPNGTASPIKNKELYIKSELNVSEVLIADRKTIIITLISEALEKGSLDHIGNSPVMIKTFIRKEKKENVIEDLFNEEEEDAVEDKDCGNPIEESFQQLFNYVVEEQTYGVKVQYGSAVTAIRINNDHCKLIKELFKIKFLCKKNKDTMFSLKTMIKNVIVNKFKWIIDVNLDDSHYQVTPPNGMCFYLCSYQLYMRAIDKSKKGKKDKYEKIKKFFSDKEETFLANKTLFFEKLFSPIHLYEMENTRDRYIHKQSQDHFKNRFTEMHTKYNDNPERFISKFTMDRKAWPNGGAVGSVFFPLINEEDRKINFFEADGADTSMRLSKLIFPNSSKNDNDNYELNTMVDINIAVAHDNNMLLYANHFFPTDWPSNFDMSVWIEIRDQIILDITNIVLQTKSIKSLEDLDVEYESLIRRIIAHRKSNEPANSNNTIINLLGEKKVIIELIN